jgi:hypothetical protein
MKHALIFEGILVQVEDETFDVHEDFTWVECADAVTAETHCYENGVLILKPAPVPPTYKQLRAAAYPPMADYLDAIVKGDDAQLQAYKDACLAIKARFPK